MNAPSAPTCRAADVQSADRRRLGWLIIGAVVSLVLYAVIAVASLLFQYEIPPESRPTLSVLGLFAMVFAVYLASIRIARLIPDSRNLLIVIFVSSCAFRLILLPSVPIQEIDIYRYLWDGAVCQAGISPFRFSPDQVRQASADDSQLAPDLLVLARLRDAHTTLARILSRVHHGQVPTVYPPVSQAVFLAAAETSPIDASLNRRIVTIKAWFLMFDLGTLVLVLALLRRVGRPLGLAIIYGWCPLVLKEFANSGHLDAIAVFLTTLSVYLISVAAGQGRGGCDQTRSSWYAMGIAAFAALMLGLAVGAKIYPVVLAPLALIWIARQIGWLRALLPGMIFVGTVLLVLWPMLPRTPPGNVVDTPATIGEAGQGGDPSRGLQTFFRRWEMNDFLFLIVHENLKPAQAVEAGQEAWFRIAPESLRTWIVANAAERLGLNDPWEASFLATRALTTAVFLAIALWLIAVAIRQSSLDGWLESACLTLAWFWLLSPTQNPWYWTWAVALLPFVRNRLWLLISGLAMLYYLRFWFQSHYGTVEVLGTGYHGEAFFDLVVTWAEFAPWFAALITAAVLSSRRNRLTAVNATVASTRR